MEPRSGAKKKSPSITVEVSADRMKAIVVVKIPEGGEAPGKDDIMETLREKGVIYGIKESVLGNILRHGIYNEKIEIAEGAPPTIGKNGEVKFHFDLNTEKKPVVLDDGRVDFRQLNLIQSIKKGETLCSLIPPVAGTPGKNVFGEEVAAPDGKPAILPAGKNVEVVDDGQKLIAGIDGGLSYGDGKVSIIANYEVAGDVDNSTGNINFIGNVIVRGNVLSGFSIEAGGTVEVLGVVESATIKAGGDIVLRRGMQGLGKGKLISGRDIVAKYIENSNMVAKRDIRAEAIMHSDIECGNKLELSGRKGLLVGGISKVGKEITAKVIGSYMATVTEIEVGVDPALKDRYKEVKNEIRQLEEDIKKADQAITILRKLEMAGKLTPQKQDMMLRSVKTRTHFSDKLENLEGESIQIDMKLQREADGRIKVYDYIYPGTRVTIGTSSLYVKENLRYCTLYRNGADISIGSMSK